MSEELKNLQEALTDIAASLRHMEQKIGDQESLAGQINYLFATVSAMDYVLKRLMASHAEAMPYGVVQNMLENEKMMLATISANSELSEAHRSVMTFHLQTMLKDVRAMLAQTQRVPPQEEIPEPDQPARS